jgi:alkylation response protein AidB-like acyl-CoA dehydrogenase
LNGQKRYITNASIAQVLTVMARTPVPGKPGKDAITAFLVTPDMPGFEMIEPRMEKLGIRGTATGRFACNNVRVPKENILGKLGKGLRVALTVLDFGRTTFGACCTGSAKTCLRLAVQHANTRRQFNKTLGDLDLVKKKIGRMAADVYAMEAMTSITASLIDRGLEDYMVETAMLKVFTTERLWEAVMDAFQINGGSAYFTDKPLERMLRDARINQIGEGANDVLRAFICVVGMKPVGEYLKGVLDALYKPVKERSTVWKFLRSQVETRLHTPEIPVASASLRKEAQALGKLVRDFGLAVQAVLRRHREAIAERQYIQERIADAACDLYAMSCSLSRLDLLMGTGNGVPTNVGREVTAGRYFLHLANRRIRQHLAAFWDNDDAETTTAANAALELG